MISVQYIKDGSKTLLTIIFDKFVLDKLNAKCDDYLFFFQSKFNCNNFSIVKADSGYRITRLPGRKKIYQINISHQIEGFNEFEMKQCIYFIKKNKLIKFKIDYR